MSSRYLLESGSPDAYLLEDGSGVLLTETSDYTLPVNVMTFVVGSIEQFLKCIPRKQVKPF